MTGKRKRGITADNVFYHLSALISELPDSVADQVWTVITGPCSDYGFDIARGPLNGLPDEGIPIASASICNRPKKRCRPDAGNTAPVTFSFFSGPVSLGITTEQEGILNKI